MRMERIRKLSEKQKAVMVLAHTYEKNPVVALDSLGNRTIAAIELIQDGLLAVDSQSEGPPASGKQSYLKEYLKVADSLLVTDKGYDIMERNQLIDSVESKQLLVTLDDNGKLVKNDAAPMGDTSGEDMGDEFGLEDALESVTFKEFLEYRLL